MHNCRDSYEILLKGVRAVKLLHDIDEAGVIKQELRENMFQDLHPILEIRKILHHRAIDGLNTRLPRRRKLPHETCTFLSAVLLATCRTSLCLRLHFPH